MSASAAAALPAGATLPAGTARSPVASSRSLAWTCAAFAGGVLLHIDQVPVWASGAALVLLAWRLGVRGTGRATPIALRALLALLLVGAVVGRFHTLNGLTAGTALLIVMGALKLLETRSARDQLVVLATALFLLMAACLDRQQLARLPWYALQAWLCGAALALVYAPQLTARNALELAGRTLLFAAPLALLLFLFFPRLPGAFWSLPRGEEALTGLSDTMTPGSITHLSASYDIAFRAAFGGRAPPPAERYWRGPVLHDFDGYTWRRGGTPGYARLPLAPAGEAWHYSIALEPSRHRYWFALDTPAVAPDPRVTLSNDYELLAAEPLTQAVSFEALSYTRHGTAGPLRLLERRRDTWLTPGRNPRTVALAQSLRAQAHSDAQLVQAVLEYFGRGFQYSLDPQPLGADSVDDLLFRTHAGFCGHYASAFVALMRAAGVPAHVVTGYLGGEWNPLGNYFVVRQSDAHAWAEVWLEGSGWTRVDPTAVVAPERLLRGILDLFPAAASAPLRLLRSSAWLQRLVQGWDAANNWWDGHLVKFNYDAQLRLLERLGIRTPDARYLGWAFAAALLGWLGVLAWHMGRGLAPVRADALGRAYLRLCRKLATVGAPRATHQGPLSYARALSAQRPDLSATVTPLLTRYAQLRYGAAAAGAREREVAAFRRAVARLQLRKRPPEHAAAD